MTRKFKFWIEQIANDQEEIFEYGDEETDEKIEEDARDFAMNFVSWGWTEVKTSSEEPEGRH